jgi:hypothetical protein
MAIEVLVESFLGNHVVKTRAYDKASRRRTYSLPSSPHHTFRVLSAEPIKKVHKKSQRVNDRIDTLGHEDISKEGVLVTSLKWRMLFLPLWES